MIHVSFKTSGDIMQNLTLTGHIKSKRDKGKAASHLPDKFVWMVDWMRSRSASKGRKSAKRHNMSFGDPWLLMYWSDVTHKKKAKNKSVMSSLSWNIATAKTMLRMSLILQTALGMINVIFLSVDQMIGTELLVINICFTGEQFCSYY